MLFFVLLFVLLILGVIVFIPKTTIQEPQNAVTDLEEKLRSPFLADRRQLINQAALVSIIIAGLMTVLIIMLRQLSLIPNAILLGIFAVLWAYVSIKAIGSLRIERLTIQRHKDKPNFRLGKDLKEALSSCETKITETKTSLKELSEYQKEVLDEICISSKTLKANKSLLFHFKHPLISQQLYYYTHQIHDGIEGQVLKKAMSIVEGYANQIALKQSKLQLFKKLKEAYSSNLEKVIEQQEKEATLERLTSHENRLYEMEQATENNYDNEKSFALYEEIKQQLDFQQECYQQYLQLVERYKSNTTNTVVLEMKQEIEQLITGLATQK